MTKQYCDLCHQEITWNMVSETIGIHTPAWTIRINVYDHQGCRVGEMCETCLRLLIAKPFVRRSRLSYRPGPENDVTCACAAAPAPSPSLGQSQCLPPR